MAQQVGCEIQDVGQERSAVAVDALTLAFSEDPFMRWLFEDPSVYRQWFPRFVHSYGGRAFETGTAVKTADGHGAALWLGPDETPKIAETSDLVEGVMPEPRLQELFRLGERLLEATPVEPYWHLTFIGVDPLYQNEGIGTALLKHGLERCDESDRVAYIESANPRNLSFFAENGFELVDVLRMDTGPTIYPMARPPGGSMA